MTHADLRLSKARAEMSMEQAQRDARNRSLVRQAGVEPRPWLAARVLGWAGARLVQVGTRLKGYGELPPSPVTGSMPSPR